MEMQARHDLKTLRWVLVATSFGFVVVQLDVTIVNLALPRIALDLRTGVSGLQWVVDAYTVSFAVLLLSAGVLGDRFGGRRMYVLGFVIFGLASLGCGLAPSTAVLIVSRTVQGVGAALLLPSSLSLLNHASAHDDRLRARAVAVWTAAGGVSIAAGPVVGGLLVAGLGWRSIFLVNLPLCALAIWLTFRVVPAPPRAERPPALDPAGQVLAVLALAGLTGAIIEIRPLGIGHPLVLGGLALAALTAPALIAVESRKAAPMLPVDLFRRPSFAAAVVFGILVNLTYYGVIFVLSLYLQRALGYSAPAAGLAFLPLTATFIVSNIASGWMTGRMGSRAPMICGAVLGSLGFILLSFLGAESRYPAMLPAFVLIPLGMGLAVPAMTTSILASAERARAGTASAVLNAARQAGGAVGVALFGGLAAADLVAGLRASGLLSAGLLGVAAALAGFGLRAPAVRPAPPSTRRSDARWSS
jgi:DHA2 family methylenomycin A resistance protein-like MFS transporter